MSAAEKLKPHPYVAHFVDSAPFLGESQSAAVGSRGVISVVPGRLTARGAVEDEANSHGIVITYMARDAKGQPETRKAFVPWSRIRGVTE